MLYKIGSQKLHLPEMGLKSRTPHQVVPWRDCAETCRTLDAICTSIPVGNRPFKIVDGIARAGFWAAVFLNRWPNCNLILNESDDGCVKILRENFPHARVTSRDINTWTPPESDLLLLDFDAFTLHKLGDHQHILERVTSTCHYLAIAESACFGFKFGNLKHYKVEDEKEYYKLLNKTMEKVVKKRIISISKFTNSAMVLFGDTDQPPQYIPPSSLAVSRGGKQYKLGTITFKKGVGFGLV